MHVEVSHWGPGITSFAGRKGGYYLGIASGAGVLDTRIRHVSCLMLRWQGLLQALMQCATACEDNNHVGGYRSSVVRSTQHLLLRSLPRSPPRHRSGGP